MLKAGIDIGTNTILLLVAQVKDGKVVQVLRDETRVVRLGQGVDQAKAFHPDAMERGKKVFIEYGEILSTYKNISVKAVATSGSRDAKNSKKYFYEMEKVLGFPINVISGEDEAVYSFRGALSDKSNPEDYAVIDIGGGSTEIITQSDENDKLIKHSFDMGCVRMTERCMKFNPPIETEQNKVRKIVRELLSNKSKFLAACEEKRWLGVAGTATYLSAAALGLPKFDAQVIHGSILKLSRISQLREHLAGLPKEERLGIGGMDAGRADVIVAGAIILEETLIAAKKNSLEISVRGLRYGLVL